MPAKKPSAKATKPKKTVSAPVKMSSPRSASRAVKARPAAPRKPTVRATPARPAPRPVRVVPPTVAAAAAPVCLRHHPNGQQLLTRLANNHGTGKALTILAPQLARAVYSRLKRKTAVDMASFFRA